MELPKKLIEYLKQVNVTGKSGQQFVLGAGSMSTLNNLKTLNNLFLKIKPKRTLEIGLCHGASAILFASLHEHLKNNIENCHFVMDPYQLVEWDQVGLEQLNKYELDKYIMFYNDFSYNVLPALISERISFDIIYIDGSHLFENVFIDIFYSAKLLSIGGVVLFDDSTDPHIKKVIQFVKKNYVTVLEEFDLSEFNEKKGVESLKYRVAKKLNRVQLTAFRKLGMDVERAWNSKFKNF